MEKFGNWVNEFAKTPAGIIIASALSVLLLLVYIFSKTSIGRKALNELRFKATSTRSLVETHKENVEKEVKKHKEETKEKAEKILEVVELERQEMFEVLKLVPNAKVKKFVKEHENMSVNDLLKKVEKDALKGE